MAKGKILVVDDVHPVLYEQLEREGFTCDLVFGRSREEYQSIIGDYDGIIVRSGLKLDREFLSRSLRLRFIARAGSGMENIDVEYAEERGIVCINSPEGNRDAVAEHALGMLLMLMNHIRRADREVRQGIWRREANKGEEIGGKTVAIIGYGNTGSAFARRLAGFGARVIAYDKYKSGYSDAFVEECQMDEIYREADILSLHVPLTSETTYLVNDEYLSRFSKPLWLLNTSRGKVVHTADLVKHLRSGKVKGAGLDVLEYEKFTLEGLDISDLPEPLQYLIEADNVVLTPHIAGWTHESFRKMAEVLVQKIKSIFG